MSNESNVLTNGIVAFSSIALTALTSSLDAGIQIQSHHDVKPDYYETYTNQNEININSPIYSLSDETSDIENFRILSNFAKKMLDESKDIEPEFLEVINTRFDDLLL